MLRLWLDGLGELLDSGGFTMPPLLLCAALLWGALGMRLMLLRRGHRQGVRTMLRQRLAGAQPHPHGLIDEAVDLAAAAVRRFPTRVPHTVLTEIFGELRIELAWGKLTIQSLVAVAPLLGLLGTVTGMIETFRSLADMALFTQGGGIAGGIAEALLTTQVGLAVSIPGLIAGRLLDRKQQFLDDELDRLEELLASGGFLEGAA
jgi:biopolymer transport protein ExbB